MEENNNQSRYVKLTKDHQTTVQEDIIPGELNQPIDVPQVCLISLLLFPRSLSLTGWLLH